MNDEATLAALQGLAKAAEGSLKAANSTVATQQMIVDLTAGLSRMLFALLNELTLSEQLTPEQLARILSARTATEDAAQP